MEGRQSLSGSRRVMAHMSFVGEDTSVDNSTSKILEGAEKTPRISNVVGRRSGE